MSDQISGSPVLDAPTGEATVKETPVVQPGTESVASEAKAEERAGGSQDSAEGNQAEGQDSGNRRGPSKMDTIRELRGKLRDQRSYWESEQAKTNARFEELEARLKRGQDPKPSKTFWEAPEEVMDERFKTHTQVLRDEIREMLRTRDTESQETSEWKQETSQAAEFIRSQKGLTPEDMDSIKEFVVEQLDSPKSIIQQMRPQERAEYALFKWQQNRGIGDRGALKAKASTVVGAPPAQGGQKTWTEAEIQRELDKFPKDISKYTKDDLVNFDLLEREIKQAQKDGRVK